MAEKVLWIIYLLIFIYLSFFYFCMSVFMYCSWLYGWLKFCVHFRIWRISAIFFLSVSVFLNNDAFEAWKTWLLFIFATRYLCVWIAVYLIYFFYFLIVMVILNSRHLIHTRKPKCICTNVEYVTSQYIYCTSFLISLYIYS